MLITGASSGIGEATARRLAREPGAELVLVARREDRLRQASAEELGSERVSYVAVDLLDDDAPERVRDHVLERHGRLELLVNNAGAAWRGQFADGGWENVSRTIAINFDAPVRLTEALLPLLRAAAPSAIVNVASTAGRVARPGTGAYSASKFALAGWSDSLWAEERPHGVHVGLVLPGFIVHRGLPPGRADRTRRPPAGPSRRPRRPRTRSCGRDSDDGQRSTCPGRTRLAASLRVLRTGARAAGARGWTGKRVRTPHRHPRGRTQHQRGARVLSVRGDRGPRR